MTILMDINNLIEEANALTTVTKPVTNIATTITKPVGSMSTNAINSLYTGATKTAGSIGKAWSTLSPGAKAAAAGALGVGAAGLGLAAGHTLGAAAFAPTANLLHIAPASGALHALNPTAAPIAFGTAMMAKRAIQNHYNG